MPDLLHHSIGHQDLGILLMDSFAFLMSIMVGNEVVNASIVFL